MYRRVCAPLPTSLIPLLLLTSCQSALGSGMEAYHHADYPSAARDLRKAEAQGVDAEDAPRYDLYAGLTHLALGNADRAVVHLGRARIALDAHPTYFSVAERARLQSAWRALGRMPGQTLEPGVAGNGPY